MAKDKKNFLKGKMNKDLDDRILPPGEYRDARNLAISRSEGSNVGALENILGNSLVNSTNFISSRLDNFYSVGYYVDKQFSRSFVFVTDYVDSSNNGIENFCPPETTNFIYMYDHNSDQTTILVTGAFLNFSSRYNITGINRIEDMLFWTDNRNQPRKINIETAVSNPAPSINSLSPYYKNEDSISVATYAPVNPISLLNINEDQSAVGSIKSTMTNPSLALLPDGNPNPAFESAWPGDKNYLKDRFVRFSYRFKFDDGEYSLMAPFTQIAFIPKQNGYFLAESLVDPPTANIDDWSTDAQQAYRSTVVQFMENDVTQIILNILFETSTPRADLKIKNLEILYKESDQIAIKVVESIPIADVEENMTSNFNNKVYSYKYISTQPIKTLPQDQSTRVYDMVPIRAKAQELISNRLVYGNYYDKNTPPEFIDYQLAIAPKSSADVNNRFNTQIEYPNHTVKQNRTYQIGLVLSDRYGRESSVILSNNETASQFGGIDYSADTIYGNYTTYGFSTLDWPGNSILTIFNSPIPYLSQFGTSGYAGIYKDDSYGVDEVKQILSEGTGYVDAEDVPTINETDGSQGSGLTLNITESTTTPGAISRIVVKNPGTNYRTGEIVSIDSGNGDAKIIITAGVPNPLGWHSWKIVIKQTEQEYYNVYMPGVLAGYPNSPDPLQPFTWLPTNENTVTSNVVLTNDNINKVPRDLNEVGPDQKQYRSTVGLYARVQPVANADTGAPATATNLTYSSQFVLNAESLIDVVSISTLLDSNFNTLLGEIVEASSSTQSTTQLIYDEFYASETNPLIARLNGSQQYGVTGDDISSGSFGLGVAETEPFDSALEIYYETSTCGLVRELNTSVISNEGGDIPASLGPLPIEDLWSQNEGMCPGTAVTPFMDVINYYGEVMDNIQSVYINSVTIAGAPISGFFSVDFNVGNGNQVQIFVQIPMPYDTTNPANNVVSVSLGVITTDGNYGAVEITGEILNQPAVFKERYEPDGCSVPDRYASNPTPGEARIQDLITFQLNNSWGNLNQGGQISTSAQDEDLGYGLALGSQSILSSVSNGVPGSSVTIDPYSASVPITDIAFDPEYELFDEVRIDTFYPENGLCCSAELEARTNGLAVRVKPEDNIIVNIGTDAEPEYVPMFTIKNLTEVPQSIEIVDGGSGYQVGTWSTSMQSWQNGPTGSEPVVLENSYYTANSYNVATSSDNEGTAIGTIGEGQGLRLNIIVDSVPSSSTFGQVIGLNPGRPIQSPGNGYKSGDVVRILQFDQNGNPTGKDALARINCGGIGLYINEDVENSAPNGYYSIQETTLESDFSLASNPQFQDDVIPSNNYSLPLGGGLLNYQTPSTIEDYNEWAQGFFPESDFPSYWDASGNFIGPGTSAAANGIYSNFANDSLFGIKPPPPVSDPVIKNIQVDGNGNWVGLRPQGGSGDLKIYTLTIEVTDSLVQSDLDMFGVGGNSTTQWVQTTGKYMRTDITNIGSTRTPKYGYIEPSTFGFGVVDEATYFGDASGLDGYNAGQWGFFGSPGGLPPEVAYDVNLPPFYQYKHIQNRISTEKGGGLYVAGTTDQFNRMLLPASNVTGTSLYASGARYAKNPNYDFGGQIDIIEQQQECPITPLNDLDKRYHIGGEPVEFKLPQELAEMSNPPTIKLKGYLGGYNPTGTNAFTSMGSWSSNGGWQSDGTFNAGTSQINGASCNVITRGDLTTPWPEFSLMVRNQNESTDIFGTAVGMTGGNGVPMPTSNIEYDITTRSYLYLTKPNGQNEIYEKVRNLSNVGNLRSSATVTVQSLKNNFTTLVVSNPALTGGDPIVVGMTLLGRGTFPWSPIGAAPQVIEVTTPENDLAPVEVTLNSPQPQVWTGEPPSFQYPYETSGTLQGGQSGQGFSDELNIVGETVHFRSDGLSTNISGDDSYIQIQAGAYIRGLDADNIDNEESTFSETLNYSDGTLDSGSYSIQTSLGARKQPYSGPVTSIGLEWSAKNRALPSTNQSMISGLNNKFTVDVQFCTPGTMAMYLDIDFG